MTTAYTSLLGLALPVDGELTGTWGQTVNNYITTYLDGAVAGTQIISGSLTAVTLSKTTGASLSQAGTGATGSSQYQIIRCTGNPASLLTITAPAADKTYVVINATSTSQSVKIVGAGPTTGVTITAGSQAIVAWNGSDFVNLTPAGTSGTVTSVSGTGTVSGLSLSGTVTSSGSLTLGGSITGFLPTTGGTMTGNIVFNSGQPLGTPSSGTLSSCTVDGTNAVGFKNIPQTGSDKTTAYTLVTGDVGKYVGVGTSGSIVVPTSTFANGDAISVYNNTTGNITITTSAPTAYIGGTNTVKTSITLATRGIATILFVSATVCVVTGNVS